MTVRTILLPILLCGVAVAQSEQDIPVETLTVCQLLAHPLVYDGRLVRVRARVDGTDEGEWLVGDECPEVFVTDEHQIWPSMIFLATPTSTILGRTRIHTTDFEFDTASRRRLVPKYHQLRAHLPENCISWTYTGLFETRKN